MAKVVIRVVNVAVAVSCAPMLTETLVDTLTETTLTLTLNEYCAVAKTEGESESDGADECSVTNKVAPRSTPANSPTTIG